TAVGRGGISLATDLRTRRSIMDRREFLKSSSAAAFGLGMSAELLAQPVQAQAATRAIWDAGNVLHILPQVSDKRMLGQAVFQHAADKRAISAHRRYNGTRAHERYSRRALAVSRQRPAARAALYAVTDRREWRRAL